MTEQVARAVVGSTPGPAGQESLEPAVAVDPRHPLLVAVAPLLARLDADVVAAQDAGPADVPLVWEGQTVAAVRLRADAPTGPPGGSESGVVADLDMLLDEVARELGGPLAGLGRADKQRAVRLLEERGAFQYRRSAEAVAEALGVTRFTVYNYLNRGRS
jgi:DNA binding protein with HTH domain